jgi:DinB superfamily
MQKANSDFNHDSFQQFNNDLLIDVFKQGPERMRLAVNDLDESCLLAFPIQSKWNILEIVIHTVHSEISGAMRIRQTITQSSKLFSYYDQDIWTKDLTRDAGLGVTDMNEHLELFALLRKTTSAIFEKATSGDWGKRGIHQEVGPMNLRQLLELYADHSERHIDQILERRRLLGLPIFMKELLPVRLF